MRRVSLCAVEVVTEIANLVLAWVAVVSIYLYMQHDMQHDTQHAGNAEKLKKFF